MHFVKASQSQFEIIWTMVNRVRDDATARGLRQWDENYPTKQMIFADIENGYTHFIYIDNMFIGFFTTNSICEDDVHDHIMWNCPTEKSITLHRLCIDVPHQNKGYGTQFMQYYEEYVRNAGFHSIRIDVFSTNSQAIHIYERFGYSRLGNAFCDRGEFFIYEKLL